MHITSHEDLRALYREPGERAVRKQLAALDAHCRRFVELSPFLVMSTSGASGAMDASPRGGKPGFVAAPDAHTLLIPDSPGNNRLDSLSNLVDVGGIGLLFLLPGVDETLRVNGTAVLSTDDAERRLVADERRTPALVIRVSVREAYLHCAKALMRSRLWSEDNRVPRSALPSMGRMINDQTGNDAAEETQEEMARRYAPDL